MVKEKLSYVCGYMSKMPHNKTDNPSFLWEFFIFFQFNNSRQKRIVILQAT